MKRVIASISEADKEILEEAMDSLNDMQECVRNLTISIDEFYQLEAKHIVRNAAESLESVEQDLNKIDKQTASLSILDALWCHIGDAMDEIDVALNK